MHWIEQQLMLRGKKLPGISNCKIHLRTLFVPYPMPIYHWHSITMNNLFLASHTLVLCLQFVNTVKQKHSVLNLQVFAVWKGRLHCHHFHSQHAISIHFFHIMTPIQNTSLKYPNVQHRISNDQLWLQSKVRTRVEPNLHSPRPSLSQNWLTISTIKHTIQIPSDLFYW